MSNKKPKTIKQSVAAEMMEKFIEDGTYPELKQTKEKIKKLTSSMRERLESSETKRHEFSEFNLVGRFTAKKIYETDYIGLNEYLYDLGLLLHVVEIDNKKLQSNVLYFDMIQDFKLEDTYYVKPNFNKIGRELNKLPNTFEITDQWNLTDMARDLAILKPRVKILTNEYEMLMRKMLKLPEFEKLKTIPKQSRKPVQHKYGSLSLQTNPVKYDISAIYDYIGEWILIEYGKPNAKLLERFILNGTISKKEIDQFKTIVDIELDFSVMSLEDEQKILNMLDEKNRLAAANRIGA
ncbi:hypothetical protein C0966_17045 (plasmid) [Bacillus methanolicus]|uniref:hypothetical protein n=1 Tax=Bacillus methanolicus TaxID=1471 RepID=UPI00237FDCB8|nr:hypothetical protein [Bacillus methanolicus]MDE3840974.1 hypothetical protein [Bacillus methanolicus]